jgi:hypothetical protein
MILELTKVACPESACVVAAAAVAGGAVTEKL